MNFQKGNTNTVLIVFVIIIILVGGYWLVNKNQEEVPANDGLQINIGSSGMGGEETPN